MKESIDGMDSDEENDVENAHSTPNPARRPMNAFLIFCKRHRAQVREKYPHLENRQVTKILGEWWADLPADQKISYIELAKEYKDAFLKANPDFKWYKFPTHPPRPPPAKPSNQKVPRPLTTTIDGSITFGKLADEAQMGSLSCLLTSSSSGEGSSSFNAFMSDSLPKEVLDCSNEMDLHFNFPPRNGLAVHNSVLLSNWKENFPMAMQVPVAPKCPAREMTPTSPPPYNPTSPPKPPKKRYLQRSLAASPTEPFEKEHVPCKPVWDIESFQHDRLVNKMTLNGLGWVNPKRLHHQSLSAIRSQEAKQMELRGTISRLIDKTTCDSLIPKCDNSNLKFNLMLPCDREASQIKRSSKKKSTDGSALVPSKRGRKRKLRVTVPPSSVEKEIKPEETEIDKRSSVNSQLLTNTPKKRRRVSKKHCVDMSRDDNGINDDSNEKRFMPRACKGKRYEELVSKGILSNARTTHSKATLLKIPKREVVCIPSHPRTLKPPAIKVLKVEVKPKVEIPTEKVKVESEPNAQMLKIQVKKEPQPSLTPKTNHSKEEPNRSHNRKSSTTQQHSPKVKPQADGFDLEARIEALPSLNLEEFTLRKKEKRKLPNGSMKRSNSPNQAEEGDVALVSEVVLNEIPDGSIPLKEKDVVVTECLSVTSPEVVILSTSNGFSSPLVEEVSPIPPKEAPLTGSQKRKARKQTITRHDPSNKALTRDISVVEPALLSNMRLEALAELALSQPALEVYPD